MEQSLGERRVELSKFEDETVAAQMKIKELTVKSDEYKLQDWFITSLSIFIQN